MKYEDKCFAFIVDGGNKIGMGHVYQAISLATILKNYSQVVFITKSDTEIVDKLISNEFEVRRVMDDIEVLDCVLEIMPKTVVIDKIDVSEWLAKKIKELSSVKLVIFTNLTSANRYADVAVTADIGSSFKNICYTNKETQTRYYYGPKYWVLRREFYKHVKKEQEGLRQATVKKILLMFGGSDPSNITTMVLEELLGAYDFLSIDVIIGAAFRHDDSVIEVMKRFKFKDKEINLHKDTNNVAELMYNSDLVIASPGLSAFEALYVGTPILLIPQNDLQAETYKGHFVIIEKSEVKEKLLRHITCGAFTFPGQTEILDMDIGGGVDDLVKEIVEGSAK